MCNNNCGGCSNSNNGPTKAEVNAFYDGLAELVTETGPNLGKLMGLLKERYAGQYDGKMASTLAKKLL